MATAYLKQLLMVSSGESPFKHCSTNDCNVNNIIGSQIGCHDNLTISDVHTMSRLVGEGDNNRVISVLNNFGRWAKHISRLNLLEQRHKRVDSITIIL